MPEQPPDPLHYDMMIPPEPDAEKQRAPEKPGSDENQNAPDTAKDTNVVRGDDRSQAGRGSEQSGNR